MVYAREKRWISKDDLYTIYERMRPSSFLVVVFYPSTNYPVLFLKS